MKIFSALLVFFGTSSLVTIEVLHVLSELSELIELPERFSSMKKCLFCGALRLGDPLIKLLELRFVSLSSETSRSFQTSQSSQSSITSHPAFPDVVSLITPLPSYGFWSNLVPTESYFQGASNATGYERFGEELAEDVGYYRKLTRWSRSRILVPSFL